MDYQESDFATLNNNNRYIWSGSALLMEENEVPENTNLLQEPDKIHHMGARVKLTNISRDR